MGLRRAGRSVEKGKEASQASRKERRCGVEWRLFWLGGPDGQVQADRTDLIGDGYLPLFLGLTIARPLQGLGFVGICLP
jgi:hypothetical protein